MFLQDIAVKLNDFGVLVQLLVVDFFKFCFRNANVAIIIIYILPKLLSLLLNALESDTQERDRHLIEKPLRVEISLQKITASS